MSTLPLILVTNDDGIASPGLLAAAEAVADLGQLLVVAPATQQTGMGRAAPVANQGGAVRSTLRIRGQDLPVYAVPGSPAQAVMYGMLVLAGRKPALAVSGINYGENLGTTTTASGTVGAALEAATYGVPGLAVSLETDKAHHYQSSANAHASWRVAAQVTRTFASRLLEGTLPFDVDVLKIDVPVTATFETPWRLTRQSRQQYFESFPVGPRPLPKLSQFDYQVRINREVLEPDSDIHAFVEDGVVSVTPLSIDLTSRTDFHVLDTLLRNPVL